MKKNNHVLKTGHKITADIIERLSESYYIVKDRYVRNINEDSLTLISLPPELDIQIGETVTVDGNYLITEDINFINSSDILNINRCNDALSALYVKEISALSKGMKDYDFVIQISKNKTNIYENIVKYLDGYKWEISLKKQTIMCISPPADLSPNTFFYAQSSQRLFFHKNIPITSERLRWNAAYMIAKAIIPSKKVSKYDYDKIATWLIMRDKRFSLEYNEKLIDFIEECRAFEFICGNNSYISLIIKQIKDKFFHEEYKGLQNEVIDVLGLKQDNKKPSIIINQCCKNYADLRDNILTPSQAKKNIISNIYNNAYHKRKTENIAIQLYNFMNNCISFDSEDYNDYEQYKTCYYKNKNEYNKFCLKNNIYENSPLDGLFINKQFFNITKKANKKASCIQIIRKTRKNFCNKNNEKFKTTLYSNKKWKMMPIQRQAMLNSMTNNELVNVLISQARYLYTLIDEFIERKIFSSHDRVSIRKEILNLGALIAETQFGIDKDTQKKREYYFHFKNRYFREDYVALLRSIHFFDKIFNINAMITFFNQLKIVLESIFLQDNYPNYKEITVNNVYKS